MSEVKNEAKNTLRRRFDAIGSVRKTRTASIALLLASASFAVSAATTDFVEFYNAPLNYLFRTAVPKDITLIETGGAGQGWSRSGNNFRIWPTQGDAPLGALPVYRYYNIDPLTHFHTAIPSEIELLDSVEKSQRAQAAAAGKPHSGLVKEYIEGYVMLPVDGKCPAGTQPVYRNFNPAFAKKSASHRFSTALTIHQEMADRGWVPEGVSMCVPGVSTAQRADAYRLLGQATFGPTEALANRVEAIGIESWLAEQFAAPKSNYPNLPFAPYIAPDNCRSDGTKPATDPQNICARDTYSLFQLQLTFLRNALNGEDQLRQRVAFALSQILVTSSLEINHAYGMARYQQLMVDNAFGNYKDLLTAVTLSPAMGRYLDMANSNKPDAARGISANENYAREIMQLFSIGLYELNQDGTYKRDAGGKQIPTYSQTTVENLARVFTGWTYASFGGGVATRNNPVYYEFPMVPVESNHDTGAKTLMNGFTVPAGQSATKDLTDAIDHLFNHPNTAPFISKQLIQKLVSGDPSPAYVARVAGVFANNGSGTRGDLRAVVRAILVDPEARGEIKMTPASGHLKEPALFAIGLARGLGGTNDGVYTRGQLGGLGQGLFASPTVFNFYSPDNQISNGKLGPEFEILTSSNAFARINFVNNMVMGNGFAADPSVSGATGTSINWAPWQALAGDPAALVDRLSWIFTRGAMSVSAQNKIAGAVNAVAATDTLTRAKTAAYLVISSSQSQVER
jgi:uncharacterized protein (DUF1800 family)